jgi:hypothetical protein
MGSRNFFAELKRRDVYKVAVVYSVTAWLLIQAASILLPTFEAPAWVMKVIGVFSNAEPAVCRACLECVNGKLMAVPAGNQWPEPIGAD